MTAFCPEAEADQPSMVDLTLTIRSAKLYMVRCCMKASEETSTGMMHQLTSSADRLCSSIYSLSSKHDGRPQKKTSKVVKNQVMMYTVKAGTTS